jgi:hypothetical protein
VRNYMTWGFYGSDYYGFNRMYWLIPVLHISTLRMEATCSSEIALCVHKNYIVSHPIFLKTVFCQSTVFPQATDVPISSCQWKFLYVTNVSLSHDNWYNYLLWICIALQPWTTLPPSIIATSLMK